MRIGIVDGSHGENENLEKQLCCLLIHNKVILTVYFKKI